ncbi:hypothetical protein GF380_02315 [Candidatus Uhrbacteria bacterium]|nr:hypothetical protein [Candidatus Uhrbacteria bacterium]
MKDRLAIFFAASALTPEQEALLQIALDPEEEIERDLELEDDLNNILGEMNFGVLEDEMSDDEWDALDG